MTRRAAVLFTLLPLLSPPEARPRAEMSTIAVPIRASLAPLLPLVESQVPVRFDSGTTFELDAAKRFGVRYRVIRGPISLRMVGTGLHAQATVRYSLEACRRTWNPVAKSYAMWPCVSCGFDETPREAWIALHSRIGWNAQWRLRTQTSARPAEFPKPCHVTMFNIDISRWKIAPLVDEQLAKLAASIDANAPKLTTIRAIALEVWNGLQSPVEIAPRVWLRFEPADVSFSPIRGSGLDVTSTLSLRARTSVAIGDRPAAPLRPLPQLRIAEANGSGLRVPVDVVVPWAEASRLMTGQFGNRKYRVSGRDLELGTIVIAGAQGDRVTIEAQIDYRGGPFRNYRGPVRLVGTPRFDAATNSVVLAGLDYEIDRSRRSPFLRIADRVAHQSVRERLAASARWPVGRQLAAVRAEIERGLNRQIGKNAKLGGRVEGLVPAELTPGADSLGIRVVATGHAEVVITP